VLLPYYSPLKVAEVFRMLEALFPGRIDLGIGRAPGGDQVTAQAVSRGHYTFAEDFPQQVRDLVGFLDAALPPDHPFARVKAMPAGDTAPEIWQRLQYVEVLRDRLSALASQIAKWLLLLGAEPAQVQAATGVAVPPSAQTMTMTQYLERVSAAK
jgi:alkanesulfonate monooxygenase SsuD/methylene tetrahydromethanopterin reductase-like flavin-dependent oxidoreductase (luciferase family)